MDGCHYTLVIPNVMCTFIVQIQLAVPGHALSLFYKISRMIHAFLTALHKFKYTSVV